MTVDKRKLNVRRHIKASPETVFDAWTDPEKMQKWWGLKEASCPCVEIDLKVGGAYRIANALPDGRVIWITGYYEAIIRPNRLVYTWSVDGGAPEKVEVSIDPSDNGSLLTICHFAIPDTETYSGHERGWMESLNALEVFLA